MYLDKKREVMKLLKVPKRKYFEEAEKNSENILKNIKKSKLQDKYREYLADFRGFKKNTLEESYMFYILDGGELDEIIESEVIRRDLNLQIGEYIRNKERFVFPVLDQGGFIVAWIGYDYESDLKYILSFPNYSKKELILYNKQNIRNAYEEDICIVVEGHFDSLRLNELGFYNNVALLGKRMTDFHVRILDRFETVILIPDSDSQGKKALDYWLKVLNNKKVVVNIKRDNIIKKIYKEGSIKEEDVEVKDIDDCLQIPDKKEKMYDLYSKIKRESINPFFKYKEYSL